MEKGNKLSRTKQKIVLSTSMILLAGSFGASPSICQEKAAAGAKNVAEIDFPALLKKAAEYCRRLEGSIFDFFCREEINETIDVTLDANRPTAPMSEWRVGGRSGGSITLVGGKVRRFRNSFVYDYQCIRADRVLTEKRTLLKEGREKRNIPDAKLELSGFAYFNSLLSPINLFGEKNQPDYDFSIIGKEKFERRPVLVVEAKLKAGVTAPNCLAGKAWINPETADILKMELTLRPTGGLEMFAKREAQYNRKLRLTLRSEFSAEKNGIRFPSRILIEEAYLNDLGRAFIRSKTEVVYKDFKFFTVATESQVIR
jgi:hypothetical protein